MRIAAMLVKIWAPCLPRGPPGRQNRQNRLAHQGQDGEHAPVVVLGVGQAELLEDRLHVALDGARAHEQRVGDRAVRAALGQE
jgi:hypothetical protein